MHGISAYKQVQVSFARSCAAEVISLEQQQPIVQTYILSFEDSKVVELDSVVPGLYRSDIVGCNEPVYSLVRDALGTALTTEEDGLFKMVAKKLTIQISSKLAAVKQHTIYI